MYVAHETTKWAEGEVSSNHTYVFAKKPDARERQAPAIAYIKAGTKQVIKFKQPLKLDLRGRTFEEVK
jgi:hypothetical protein